MKKWLVLLFVILISCTKQLDIPVGSTLQPIVKFEITPSEGVVLPYGAKAKISWKVTNADVIKLNGKYVSAMDSMNIQLFKDSTFTIVATNSKHIFQEDGRVTVGNWMTSNLGLLTHSIWFLNSEKIIQNGVYVADMILGDQEKSDQYQYTLDGKANVNGMWSCNWSFIAPDSILVGGQRCYFTLTTNKFVRGIPTTWYELPAISEETYIRP